MNRQHILGEIKRTAQANGGIPLGRIAFQRETGIKESDWLGKFWIRWSEAIKEAGFVPNSMQRPFTDASIIDRFIKLIRELGHYPVAAEVKMKARTDTSFPSHNTFARFGTKGQFAARILSHCSNDPQLSDVVDICAPLASTAQELEPGLADAIEIGFVYLLRSGRFYKIGRSNAAGRRERELAIQLPEKAGMVHVIRTDDPTGIEAYWHRRFESKRMNGEWFQLRAEDLRAFKRRKFM
jgi:hypothetical protein